MYEKPSEYLEKCRMKTGRFGSKASFGNNGVFVLAGPEKHKLFCIASNEMEWEHVSVSLHHKIRLPTWTEMCFVKALFWAPQEIVVQYHPAEEDYINFQGSTLHLWAPVGSVLPHPPHWMVGPKNAVEGLDLMAEMTGRKPIKER
jgi:hypothetical protein